jgi:uncharacterized protein YfaS (alpha-2-macroglobulin family)
MLASVNDWLIRFASTPAPTLQAGRLRAYAVYLLARQGLKQNNALSNVEQELSHRYPQAWPTDMAAGWLAATYRLMQRNNDAERTIAKIPWARQKHDWAEEEVYYGPVVHDAQLLYVLAKYFPARLGSVPATALEDIGAEVSGNRVSSLSAAWTLLALDAYAKAASAGGKLGVSEIAKDGRQQSLAVTPGAIAKAVVPPDAAKVLFSKEGPLAAYFSLNESGFDRNAPTAAISQGIEIFREFLDLKGNPVTRVKVGEEFLVRLRVRSTKRDRVPQIAVVDLLPGGTEAVLELRPPSDSSTPEAPAGKYGALPIGLPDKSNWTVQHIDLREDRLILYGDATKDAGTFVYRARATNAGIYQSPPAFAEGLYDRKVTGTSVAGKLEIVKP